MRDYEELVKALRRLADEQFFDFEKSPYIKAADAIEGLQKRVELEYQSGFADGQRAANRKKNKWISTAERQPEKSGLYLTYHAKRGSMTMHYSANNKAWNAFDHEGEPKYALEVTHWMPISEPPEEENAMTKYIDADKLKAHYAWWGDNSSERTLFDAIIDVQPAADVRSVVKARWIHMPSDGKFRDTCVCSACKKSPPIESWIVQGFNACPYCFADMREEN